jgi:release factor glutamine methyltransferase
VNSAAPPPHQSSDNAESTPWTVRRILDWTIDHLKKHGSESPRLDAEILLAHARGCQRIELYTRYDEVMTQPQREIMRGLVRRRANAEPVAYLVGHREFFSLSFEVTSDVLIPRPETETLVLEAIEIANGLAAARILEIGTGSGCIAVSIAKQCPRATIVTVDVSEVAIAVAQRNAQKHGVADRIHFRHGSMFDPVGADDRFDLLVSNPPYICSREIADLSADVRDHEPHLALDGGEDGLQFARTIVADGPKFLDPGSVILMEISPEQSGEVCECSQQVDDIDSCRVIRDLSGTVRVMKLELVGTLPVVAAAPQTQPRPEAPASQQNPADQSD